MNEKCIEILLYFMAKLYGCNKRYHPAVGLKNKVSSKQVVFQCFHSQFYCMTFFFTWFLWEYSGIPLLPTHVHASICRVKGFEKRNDSLE